MKQGVSLPRLRFGVFEANPQTGELRKEGLKIRLSRHAFTLLALLLERPGQLRTREEIRQQLWGNDVFVNFDQSLNKAVHQLRDALGDNAANPHYIETVPERGYKFIYFPQSGSRPAKKHGLHSGRIAVLPFGSEPANGEMELLNKLVIERLIDRLSLTPGLRVLAYSTVQCYRRQEFDPRAVGHQLLVPTVVIGDMTQSGDHLLLHVEVIDVRDGTLRWGDQFKQSHAEAHSDPGALADRIYDELRPVLAQTIPKRSAERALHSNPSLVQMSARPKEAHGPGIRVHSGAEED